MGFDLRAAPRGELKSGLGEAVAGSAPSGADCRAELLFEYSRNARKAGVEESLRKNIIFLDNCHCKEFFF